MRPFSWGVTENSLFVIIFYMYVYIYETLAVSTFLTKHTQVKKGTFVLYAPINQKRGCLFVLISLSLKSIIITISTYNKKDIFRIFVQKKLPGTHRSLTLFFFGVLFQFIYFFDFTCYDILFLGVLSAISIIRRRYELDFSNRITMLHITFFFLVFSHTHITLA